MKEQWEERFDAKEWKSCDCCGGLSNIVEIKEFIANEIKLARKKLIIDADNTIAEFGDNPGLVLSILQEGWHGEREQMW